MIFNRYSTFKINSVIGQYSVFETQTCEMCVSLTNKDYPTHTIKALLFFFFIFKYKCFYLCVLNLNTNLLKIRSLSI